MKKSLSLILVIVMLVSSLAFIGSVSASAAEGVGGKPIGSAKDFMELIADNPDGDYYLTADIDFGGKVFDTYLFSQPFRGTLNGQGYSIKNLSFKNENGVMGFFSAIEGATIKNISFGADKGGKIAVEATNFKKWTNFGLVAAKVTAKETTENSVGYSPAIIENVHVYADIIIFSKGTIGSAGGIVGMNTNSAKLSDPLTTLCMTDCTMNGSLSIFLKGSSSSVQARIAGMVGKSDDKFLVAMSDCTNNASIKVEDSAGPLSVGGLISSTAGGSFDYCTNNGDITLTNITNTGSQIGVAASCGGIVGAIGYTSGCNSELMGCVNNGTVTMEVTAASGNYTNAGGLIGDFRGVGELVGTYCASVPLGASTNTVKKDNIVNNTGSSNANISVRLSEDQYERDTDGYVLIKTPADFKNIVAIGYNEKFRLANDIDFSGEVFDEYIVSGMFKGIIDGAGYSVKNFSFSATSGGVAIFNSLHNATIKNITFGDETAPVGYTLSAYNAYNGNYSKGLFAQETANRGSIIMENVTLWGQMDITIAEDQAFNGPIGGFIGSAQGNISMKGCTLNGSITVGDAENLVTYERLKYVGGFFGKVYAEEGRSTSLTVESCTNNADITVNNSCKEACVGTIVARMESATATVKGFTNTGDISLEVKSGTSCFGTYIGYAVGIAENASELVTLEECTNSGAIGEAEAPLDIGKTVLLSAALPPADDNSGSSNGGGEDDGDGEVTFPTTRPNTDNSAKPDKSEETDTEAAPTDPDEGKSNTGLIIAISVGSALGVIAIAAIVTLVIVLVKSKKPQAESTDTDEKKEETEENPKSESEE